MSTEQNKAIVLRFFDEAFNRGNLEVIDELISPDIVFHASDGEMSSLADVNQHVIWMRTTFHDFHVSPLDVIAEGDKVMIYFTDSGTHLGEGMDIPPTGKWVTWTGIIIFRLYNGKIIEGWSVSDDLHLLRQLGVISLPG